jgi:hypothetical protein
MTSNRFSWGLEMLGFLGKLFRGEPISSMARDLGPAPTVQDNGATAARIIMGLDLGEVKDYSALNCLHMTKQIRTTGGYSRHYACRLLVRWPLHTGYEQIIENVRTIAQNLPIRPELVIDATGAGRPVASMFRRAALPIKTFVPVIITGGTKVMQEPDGYWHVAKRELVSSVQSALQSGRLAIAKKLKESKTLIRELQTFRAKINISTSNESFEAWRAKDHDDMVLSTALALWYGEHLGRRLGPEHFGVGM